MPELLTPLPSEALDEAWLAVLDGRLAREIQQARPGQCLRIEALARNLLEALAARAGDGTGAKVYLVDRKAGPEPWRVEVHRVVARRNEGQGVVVALLPPDVKLAAGDSIDISTFRSIPIDDLWHDIERVIVSKLPAPILDAARWILHEVEKRGWQVQPSDRLRFLATIAQQERPAPWMVGAALYAVGLIPDFELLDHPGQLGFRLGQRNLANVRLLATTQHTPLERLLRLPLSDNAFRQRLGVLMRAFDNGDIHAWGEAVATRPEWRELALEKWPLAEAPPPPGQVRVELDPLRLPPRDDDLLVYEPTDRLPVAWKTDPPPGDAPGLAFFRVEVVDVDGQIVYETDLIKAVSGRQEKRRKYLKDLELPSGVYFIRVIPLTEHADSMGEQEPRDPALPNGKRTNESDDFLLLEIGEMDDDIPTPVTTTSVGSYAESELLARLGLAAEGRDPRLLRPLERAWLTDLGASSDTAMAAIRFDARRQYKVRLSQRLRRLELRILEDSQHAGSHRVTLGPAPSAPLDLESSSTLLPPAFAQARTELFTAIRETVIGESTTKTDARQGEPRYASPVVALVDLCELAPRIELYATAYADWLDSGDPAALGLDVVVAEVPGATTAALLAPTHPLRLLWLLQRQQLARVWSEAAAKRRTGASDLITIWRSVITSSGLPSLLITQGGEEFVEAGDLLGGWAAYLPPRLRDSRAALALVQARLGMSRSTPVTEITASAVADKLQAFLRQHPYVGTLVVNVINPGDAALLVDALVELEGRLEDEKLRYDLRLFTDAAAPELVGRALRDLMDPERQLSEAAAQLAGPGRSPLFPKLTWSRKPLTEFVERPEEFSAHVTVILDSFPVWLRVARVDPADRSSFVHGLVQAVPVRLTSRGSHYRWSRRPAPAPCPELPGAPNRSALVAKLVEGVATGQVRLLAPNSNTASAIAVTELNLSTDQQSLLYTAHANSTWVMTIDPNLGLEYFDATDRGDRPGYLLDFTPGFAPSGQRQLLLTTRAGEELLKLVLPLVEQLGLDRDGPGSKLLIESMRALSGRLALRLLASPNQAQGALGMALTKLFCEGYGLLSQAMVVPLDAHPELAKRDAGPALRGDLLVVSADPDHRHLDLLVIESKCHSGSGLDDSLRARIHDQVMSSAAALRDTFEIAELDDRIDRHVQSWRLSTVLTFYLDRAERYGLIDGHEVSRLRQFLVGLDRGYTMSVRTIGLVFRPDAAATRLDTEDPDLPIWVAGHDVIDRLLNEGMRRLVVDEKGPAEPGPAEPTIRGVMSTEPTWDTVRSSFAGPSLRADTPPPSAEAPEVDQQQSPREETDVSADVPQLETPAAAPEIQVTREARPVSETQGPEFSVLLGDTQPTKQFGLLGTMSAEAWQRVALDLNGCNTISVYGVQGGGKSYTLGSIIEMASQPIPGINLLPQPLASVVFHYHQTQDYPPEFVSMVSANDDPAQVQALASYGAEPMAVPDVIVLTTSDTVDRRRMEFPAVQVEPIAFASRELTVADWRFLMGATGNDSLYLKILNEMMRWHRDDLTLDAIRAGLSAARLTDGQRMLAETRLEFAARFIDDSRSLRDLLKPGRIVIVDLRDEFIEQDEALGLFVTMLNVFSGAGLGPERFNKLIVFDEAHKYLGGSLIDEVVQVIREMRHKGVSLVIASQDPLNVPSAVIELSSAVILHRFNAPNWLKHIQKSLAALGDLTAPMLAGLSPGEAFVWANRATNTIFTRRAVKLRLRPRATKHGGSTRLAVEE